MFKQYIICIFVCLICNNKFSLVKCDSKLNISSQEIPVNIKCTKDMVYKPACRYFSERCKNNFIDVLGNRCIIFKYFGYQPSNIFDLDYCEITAKCLDNQCNYVTHERTLHFKNVPYVKSCTDGNWGQYDCSWGPTKDECISRTTTTTTTPKPDLCVKPIKCKEDLDLIPNECDCHKFYQCQLGNENKDWFVYGKDCPISNNTTSSRLYFDTKLSVCSSFKNNTVANCAN